MNKEIMIKFWYKRGLLNYLLLPLSFLWWLVTFIRLKQKGRSFKSFIICIGNISVGGGGKTPFTLYLFKELTKLDIKVAILSKGYGGQKQRIPLLVNPKIHSPTLIGDEAFLMSKIAPVAVSKNRVSGIKFLENLEYDIILMDDGLQNPTVCKDLSILLFNTINPFGNGFIIPAGPLRESLKSAAKRTDIVVGVGENNNYLHNLVKKYNLDYLSAKIEADPSKHNLDLKYLAFAGIAYPNKFYSTLEKYGFKVEKFKSFKDHYFYTDNDIEKLLSMAKKYNLKLITTTKDYVKINPKYHSFIDNLEINLTLDKASINYLIQLILFEYKGKKSYINN